MEKMRRFAQSEDAMHDGNHEGILILFLEMMDKKQSSAFKGDLVQRVWQAI